MSWTYATSSWRLATLLNLRAELRKLSIYCLGQPFFQYCPLFARLSRQLFQVMGLCAMADTSGEVHRHCSSKCIRRILHPLLHILHTYCTHRDRRISDGTLHVWDLRLTQASVRDKRTATASQTRNGTNARRYKRLTPLRTRSQNLTNASSHSDTVTKNRWPHISCFRIPC